MSPVAARGPSSPRGEARPVGAPSQAADAATKTGFSRPKGPAVLLHIYDVSGEGVVQQVNDVFRPLQTGMFHAGVEVLGREWSFGYAPCGSGITWCQPQGNLQHKYRETLEKGRTPLTVKQVIAVLERMHKEWPGCHYDLLTRNCCHFSDALCRELGVGPAPEWVTNMAGAGAMLRSGVNQAVTQAHAAAGAAAARASELDDRYKISSKVDDFTTKEVTVDEEYLKTRAKDLWSQASMQMGHIGSFAERWVNEAQKPISIDVGGVEAAAANFWSWATGEKQSVAQMPARTPAAPPPQAGSPRAAGRGLAEALTKRLAPPAAPAVDSGALRFSAALPTRQPSPPSESHEPLAPGVLAPEQAAAADAPSVAEAPAACECVVPTQVSDQLHATAEEQPRTEAQEARRQAEFAASALDFGDGETARACIRKALACLEQPETEAPTDAALAEDIPYKTRTSAQKKAEQAASVLDGGDKLVAVAALRDALQLLEGP